MFPEVLQICESLDNNKAIGLDYVANEHVKCGGLTLSTLLCALFNLILQCGMVPFSWKESVVIPLFTGGKKLM